jgi:two-component system phosphate regulon sensor histidine kinase PhoR
MIAILSNFGIQLHLLHMAFSEGQKKFSQTVHIALLEVVRKMYGRDIGNMPETGPVKKVSNDYYVVDVNDHIRADVLEYYLKSELRRFGIEADFEYGIYDCESDQMVYGNYISLDTKDEDTQQGYLPKYPDLVYYFGIRFPQQANYVIGTLKIWIVLTSFSLLILLFFVFVIFTVLQQKRLSELQHDFVNNMTHEFKTPITSTKIALEYLQNNELSAADERCFKIP